MNAQKTQDLVTLQHILGLKDATHTSSKLATNQLQHLNSLKEQEPVFICVDLEAFEFAQDKITEVGVSVLDTRNVLGTDPGANGINWLSKINTRHLIIKNYKHLVNKRFVHGCPDKFNFGVSELVSLTAVHHTLSSIFDNPSPETIRATDQGPRKLILVGHGLSNDTTYLKSLNFAPHAKGNIIQDIDTQRIAGSKKNSVGLSRMMAGLGLECENLHNAGNDAAYTLQGLVVMAVQHTENPGAFLRAVSDAKGKVDPAKQRYKEHRAAVREKKAAEARVQEEKVAQKALRLQTAIPVTEVSEKNGDFSVSPTLSETRLPAIPNRLAHHQQPAPRNKRPTKARTRKTADTHKDHVDEVASGPPSTIRTVKTSHLRRVGHKRQKLGENVTDPKQPSTEPLRHTSNADTFKDRVEK